MVKALLDLNFKVFSLSRNVCEELYDRLVNIKCDVANEKINWMHSTNSGTTSQLDICSLMPGFVVSASPNGYKRMGQGA